MNMSLGAFSRASNERILNIIRDSSSLEYQKRVPIATRENISNTLNTLMNYRPLWNEFESALVNKIASQVGKFKQWENPLREFKNTFSTFGNTIEEYQIGLLKAHNYSARHDYGEAALFGRELPDVQTNYHTLNREDTYRITINQDVLGRAFYNEGGISSYVSDLMSAPVKSANVDEFLLTTKLFSEYESRDGFFKVNIPDLNTLSSSDADARKALRIMRAYAGNLKFVSNLYNAAKLPTHSNGDDLVLFASPEFVAAIDVDALAAAFNISHAQLPYRVVEVPRESFKIDGCQAILTTTDFFIIGDVKNEMTSQWNPAGLYTNYFWHVWQIISTSRFVPAILFTSGEGTVLPSVSNEKPKITAAFAAKLFDANGTDVAWKVRRGGVYDIRIPSPTTDPVSTINISDHYRINLLLDGNQSTRTHISNGFLHIGQDEAASTIGLNYEIIDGNGRYETQPRRQVVTIEGSEVSTFSGIK